MTKLELTADERRALAAQVGVSEAVLYQALSGNGSGMAPARCVKIERDSGMRLRRWHLRPKDWGDIWPELTREKEAPEWPPKDRITAEQGA